MLFRKECTVGKGEIKIFFHLLFICFGIHYSTMGQELTSAKSLGMGDAGLAAPIYSSAQMTALRMNAASLAYLSSGGLTLSHQFNHHQPEVKHVGLVIGYPIKRHFLGLSVRQFSLPEALQKLDVDFNYAKRFSPSLALAMTMLYSRIQIPTYFYSPSYALKTQLYFRANSALHFGLSFQTPRVSAGDIIIFDTPSSMIGIGGYYAWNADLGFASDVLYVFKQGLEMRAGVNYNVVPNVFAIRLGIKAKEFIPTTGIGVQWKKFALDVGTEIHPRLGLSPQLDFSYSF